MKVIDQINGSALFAQSAYSAAVATKDDLGRDITATYLTAHQSLDGYATTSDLEQISAELADKLDVTAQVISSCETSSVDDKTLVTKLNGNEIAVGYAGSAHVADIALKDYQGNSFIPFYAKTSALEEKLDTTAFSTVSGDFLTAHQSLSDYYTKDETSGKEELAQAFANIPGGDTEVNAYVYNNSASIDGTTSVVQSNSGTWSDITAYQSNSASYLTGVDLTPYVPVSSIGTQLYEGEPVVSSISGVKISAFVSRQAYYATQSIDAATANVAYRDANNNSITTYYQPKLDFSGIDGTITAINSSALAGDTEVNEIVHTNSATWNTVTDKLDTTSFSDVSGSFLTAVDLTPYQTIEGMTAYQPAGDYVQGSELSLNSNNKISAISGYGLAGGAISSYTSAWSYDVPPYGDYVINSLNGKYLSAFVSQSADKAKVAINANSATYAQTVDETKLENDGFVKNLTSEYGTISVVRNTIESTNSAISRVGNEGFVSSFQDKVIGPSVTANFSWDKSLPNTTFNFTENYASTNTTITYSANTNLTGEVTVTSVGAIPFSIEVPNATELNVWANDWIQIKNNVASAADTFETVVGELAWASALPTYQYDEQDRISAINSSALAGGGDVPEDVMVESAIGYNAVNEISGYNGSAIAQYGAEKQWLVHDGTLCHLSNSAQYALGVNLSAVAQLLGVDETVLYSGNAFRVSNGGSFNVTTALSENVSSFKKIVFRMSDGGIDTSEIVCTPVSNGVAFNRIFSYGGQWVGISGAITGNGMSANIGGGNGNNAATCHTAGNWWDNIRVESIYGIGRKQ